MTHAVFFFDLTKLLDDIGAFTFIEADVALTIMLMQLRSVRGLADEISCTSGRHQPSNEFMYPISFLLL